MQDELASGIGSRAVPKDNVIDMRKLQLVHNNIFEA